MKLIPSDNLLKHLVEQNVKMPLGGFDIPDTAYADMDFDLRRHPIHFGESEVEIKDRVDYAAVWRFHGVSQNNGSTGQELENVQKTASLTRQIVEMADTHLPNAADKVSAAIDDSANVIHAAVSELKAVTNFGHQEITQAVAGLKMFSAESHAEVLKVRGDLHADLMELLGKLHYLGKWLLGIIAAGFLFLAAIGIAGMILGIHAHGQSTVIIGAQKGTTTSGAVTASDVDANHKALDVSIVAGGGTGGGPADTAPSATASESDVARQKVTSVMRLWDQTGLAGAQLVTARGDLTSGMWVNCKNGCAGGSTTPTDGFANPTTAGLSMTFPGMWNGSTWDRVRGDTTNGLWVNCKNGCAGGSSTPSDAFANPTTAGLSQGFTMMWNGTTWDRVKGDTTSGLWVNLKNASIAVTGTFFQATQPVSGTFWQATQPVSIATMPSTPVTGTFWQATQPVSGTFFQATQPVSNAGTFSVQCTSGCAGGASTPADTFANPTTAGLQMTFGMLWNGTSWDRWYGDKTNGAFVNVKNASLAVTGTFWQATQPVSGTFWQATQPVSIATMPSTPVTGTFWQATQPVSLASAPTTAVTNQGLTDLDAAIAAVGAAAPANALQGGFLGSGATGGFLKGAAVGDTYKNINISTATTTLLVTGVFNRQVRISSIHMVTAGANNVALIEGTGATCGTGSAGMAGGTTAASGYNFAANGGMTLGSGLGTVMQTATTGDSVCAVTSAATQLSGGMQYTIY